MYLAIQQASPPEQFGVALVIEPGAGFDPAAATRILADRVPAVRRLRQRLMRVPLGCGRAVWVDDVHYTPERHIQTGACAPPGDERAMLDVAGDLLMQPLPLDRPLWAARWVTGLTGGRVALVLVVQHALADGLGGLAVLDALVDGAPPPSPRPFPMPLPSRGDLAAEALATRARAVAEIPGLIRIANARPRVRPGPRIGRAAPCSLLQSTGPRRTVTVASAPLGGIREVAERHGATVNDVILTAVTGALHTCLERRGEDPPAFVIGIPVSHRSGATASSPGNHFTEARAALAGGGDPLGRLHNVSSVMRIRKTSPMPSWLTRVAATMVRALVALRVYDWYMRRQRFLHTVVTDLRGPSLPKSFCGAPITEMVPLAAGGGGNVAISFAALSYADTLTVTVTADPEAVPDLSLLTALLQAELNALGRPTDKTG
jgi:diacylglycerol O-acyltransferase